MADRADTHAFAGLGLRRRPPGSARVLWPQLSPFLAEYRAKGEAAVAEPFMGITTDGTPARGLFHLARTGVPTEPIIDAALAFLAALTAEQLLIGGEAHGRARPGVRALPKSFAKSANPRAPASRRLCAAAIMGSAQGAGRG